MEVATITSYSQTGNGVSWISLSNVDTSDNRYAYVELDGSLNYKNTPKPITFEGVCFKDLKTFNRETNDLVVEYKLYIDDEVLDGTSNYLHPNIIFNFADGSSFTVTQDKLVKDNITDNLLVSHIIVNNYFSVTQLNTPFTVEFDFKELNSIRKATTRVYLDYVQFKIVNSLNDSNHYVVNMDVAVDPNEQKEPVEYVCDEITEVNLGSVFNLRLRCVNRFEDEFFILYLQGLDVDRSTGVICENGYFEIDDTLDVVRFYPVLEKSGDVFTCNITYTVTGKVSEVRFTDNYELVQFVAPMKTYPVSKTIFSQDGEIGDNFATLGEVNRESYQITLNNPRNVDKDMTYFVRVPKSYFISQSVVPPCFNEYVNGEFVTQSITSQVTVNNVVYYQERINVPISTYGVTSREVVLNLKSDIFNTAIENVPFLVGQGDSESNNIFYKLEVGDLSSYKYDTIAETSPQRMYSKSYSRIDVFITKGASELTNEFDSHNFFKLDKPLNDISVELPIAYIGSVRLNRGHDASVTNNTTNDLINEVYQNRAYMGKKGNWDEEISMKLRLPWRDVVTLQNHTYHDAPIPIDIYPNLPNGDPLNHRGWAEIYAVKNIKKINDMLYECEPSVKYITHDLIGKFDIDISEDKVCPVDVGTTLTTTHEYYEDVRDVAIPSLYRNFINMEIDEDKYKGVYTVDSDSTYTFTSTDMVKAISDWSFRWRNLLFSIDSEAHDGEHWEMSFCVKDYDTDELLLEYKYYNFRHINNSDELVNECDVKVTRMNENGIYEVSNYTRMNLDFDPQSAFAYDDRINTSLIVQEFIQQFERGKNTTIKLIDWNGNPLGYKFVDVNLFKDGEEIQSFSVQTNSNGVGNFEFNQDNGVYTVQYKFVGDDSYYECYAESELDMRIQAQTETHFDIESDQTIYSGQEYFEGYLRDGANRGLIGEEVEIRIKRGKNRKYSTPYIKTTDSNGKFRIKIGVGVSGTWYVQTKFNGHGDYLGKTEEHTIKVIVGTGATTKLNTSNMTILSGGKGYTFDAKLTTEDGKALANQTIVFTLYGHQYNHIVNYTKTTNSNGVAKLGINLNSGIYIIDTSYDGITGKYKPVTNTNQIIVRAEGKESTLLTMPNLIINDNLHHELGATLTNEQGQILINYPIRFDITYLSNGHTITYIKNTNTRGMAELDINLKTGKYRVKATFEGLNNYSRAVTYCDMTIKRPSNSETVKHKINKKSFSANESIYLTLTDNNDDPLSGFPVSIYWYDLQGNKLSSSDTIVTTTRVTKTGQYETDSNGQLGFRTSLTGGTYILEMVSYFQTVGLKNYSPLVTRFTVSLSSNTKKSTVIVPHWTGNFTTYPSSKEKAIITLKDSDGLALVGKTIKFTIFNSNKVYYKTTNKDGEASLSINASARSKQNFTIEFEGDEGFSSSIYESGVIIADGYTQSSADIPSERTRAFLKWIDNGVVREFPYYIQAELHKNSISGEAIANQSLQFTVVGENNEYVDYYRTTDANGLATLEFLEHENNTYQVIVSVDSKAYICDELTEKVIVDVEEEEAIIDGKTIDRSAIAEGLTSLETPNPVGYVGTEYGSTLDFNFNNNVLDIHDYGLAQDTSLLSGKINMTNIILPQRKYKLEMNTTYNDAIDNLVGTLLGTIQIRVHEIINMEEYKALYSRLFSSPSPLLKYRCIFTRDGEDGRTYYYDGSTSNITKRYNLSPFLQYKGGVNLESEDGISLFNIENAVSPIIVTNGLVKLAFHRRSGYIYLYKYKHNVTYDREVRSYSDYTDAIYEDNSEWVRIRAMKIDNYDNFVLEEYTQDKVKITMGDATFTIWRGRPFIQIEHENQDIKFTKQVDRVFCELDKNEFVLDPVDSNLVNKELAEFYTNNGLNLFTYDMGLNDAYNLSTDSFDKNTLVDLSTPFELDTQRAIRMDMNSNGTGYLYFPRERIPKPNGEKFSLLINRFKTNASNVSISVWGFSDKTTQIGQKVATVNITNSIVRTGALNTVRVTFNNSSLGDYKYIQFSIDLNNQSKGKYAIASQFMLYNGTTSLPYENDDYIYRLDTTKVQFNNNYYAKFYNEIDDFGLLILRPYLDDLKIGNIPKSKLTVLIPYFKTDKEYDSAEMMAIEYLYFHEEKTSLKGGEYGI